MADQVKALFAPKVAPAVHKGIFWLIPQRSRFRSQQVSSPNHFFYSSFMQISLNKLRFASESSKKLIALSSPMLKKRLKRDAPSSKASSKKSVPSTTPNVLLGTAVRRPNVKPTLKLIMPGSVSTESGSAKFASLTRSAKSA